MHRAFAILLVTALLLPAAAYDKKPKVGALYSRENQVDEIATLPKTAPATKDCVNYQWAAAVETILRAEQVPAKYEDLVMRASGGMKCYQQWDFAETTRFITNDYFVANKKLHVEATWQAGVPAAHDMIAPLQRNVPALMVWNGKPYLVSGVLYDVSYRPPGYNSFDIKEIRLVNLAVAAGKPDRVAVFRTESNDKNQIDGVLWLKVTIPE